MEEVSNTVEIAQYPDGMTSIFITKYVAAESVKTARDGLERYRLTTPFAVVQDLTLEELLALARWVFEEEKVLHGE